MKISKITPLIVLMFFAISLHSQEVGLQFYSLRNQFKKDVEGTLALIQSWGIHKVEGGDTYGMDRGAFQELLLKYDLQVVSIGVSYEELQGDLPALAERARSYGATYITCAWIPHKGTSFTFDDISKATTLFNKAGRYFKGEGITFAYHPHGYEFRPHEEGTLFDYMARNATDFSFELDVFWATHGGADPIALLERYPDKFVSMHLKDMRKDVEGNDTGTEDVETNVILGTGRVGIAGIVKKARELGIPYMFIEDESSRVVQQVPKSLEYLKSL